MERWCLCPEVKSPPPGDSGLAVDPEPAREPEEPASAAAEKRGPGAGEPARDWEGDLTYASTLPTRGLSGLVVSMGEDGRPKLGPRRPRPMDPAGAVTEVAPPAPIIGALT